MTEQFFQECFGKKFFVKIKPYIENRKYGICEMKDDREKVKK